MDNCGIEIINMLPKSTLLKLKNQCEKYLNYSVDFKQINNKNGIKARQKTFAEILEQVNATLVFKQCEESEIVVNKEKEEKVTYSTMPAQENNSQIPQQCEEIKKEKKRKKKGGD